MGHSHSARTRTPSYLDIPCWILDILHFSVVWPLRASRKKGDEEDEDIFAGGVGEMGRAVPVRRLS